MTRLTILLFLAFIFLSCDPGHAVILSNRSPKDRRITVIVKNQYKFDHLDSIAIIDSSRRVMMPVIKDKTSFSYSFDLNKGNDAVIQQGIGSPDMKEKIIIDDIDTISLTKDKRVRVKKETMSTSVVIKIE